MEDPPSPTSHGGDDVLTAGQRDSSATSHEFDTSQDALLAKQLLEDFRKHGSRKPVPPQRVRPVVNDTRQPTAGTSFPSYGGNSTCYDARQHAGLPYSPYYTPPAQTFPWQWQVSLSSETNCAK